MEFYISATTDIGTKRKINQDSLSVRKLETRTGNMVLAVLCDGMGGLKFGELASASVVSAFTDWMYRDLSMLSQYPLEDHTIRKQWSDLIGVQNCRIRAYGERYHCMTGSTVTALLLTESRYYLLNIGDSRAYEIAEQVTQLTEDHTVVANEVRLGNLTKEQADHSSIQNVLTRCVGVKETAYPDLFFGTVRKGAVYMLCSDGLVHETEEKELADRLSPKRCGNISALHEALVQLTEDVKQRGETDNITAVGMHVKKERWPKQTGETFRVIKKLMVYDSSKEGMETSGEDGDG